MPENQVIALLQLTGGIKIGNVVKVIQPLDQGWEFRQSSANQWNPAVVPGCVHTDLLRQGHIPDPFWGEQPLYDLELRLEDGKKLLDTWQGRIGLRTILLDRHADEFGESFQFVVNGRPVFAKGANWIPAHSFVTEIKPEQKTMSLVDTYTSSTAP